MDMKKLIFHVNNFFGSGHFFDPSYLKKGQKRAGTKFFLVSKNQFFHAHQPCKGIFDICIVFSHFSARPSNCSSSNLGGNWCLKMKSRGLYHTYILWKSGLLLDFQQLDTLLHTKMGFSLRLDLEIFKPLLYFYLYLMLGYITRGCILCMWVRIHTANCNCMMYHPHKFYCL